VTASDRARQKSITREHIEAADGGAGGGAGRQSRVRGGRFQAAKVT
jgi:hypothetical protein